MENKCKVLGVGFHKTGTSSLGVALETLGYTHKSCDKDAFMLLQRGHKEALLDMMLDYDSFEDWPWPFLYREAADRFPDIRFVLTMRKSYDAWFDSLKRHVDRGAGDWFSFRRYIYGFDDPSENRDHVIRIHQEHVAAVRAFAAERSIPLLEVCWEHGDGWERLCGFLGEAIPEKPFPHANADPNQASLRKIRRVVKKMVRRVLGPAPEPKVH